MTVSKKPRAAAGLLVWLLAPIGPAILVGYLIAAILGGPRQGPPTYQNQEPRWHMEGNVAAIDATPNRGPIPGPVVPGAGVQLEIVVLYGGIAYAVLAASVIAFRRD